jgi:hypothetical protein
MGYSVSDSFSGIPWTVNNPNFNGNNRNFLGDQPLQMGVSPTMPNPQATGYANQIEGIAGQAIGAGAAGVGAAQGTQGQLGALASQLQGMGAGLANQFSGNLGYANQALADAFDPQKAAYNYYLNQNQNQTASGMAQSGLAGTPYGAEVQNAGTGAFQNAWQTAQIGREATGAATATGLQNQYEQGVLGGAGLINQAGQLDIAGLNGVLQAYGLQGQDLASAGGMIQSLLSSLGISVSTSRSG